MSHIPPTPNININTADFAKAAAAMAPSSDPTAAPARPLADAKPAADRVAAILKDRDAAGCRILMKAETHSGPSSFTASLVRGSNCAVFIGVAAADAETLTSQLTTPFNETVSGPPAAKEIIFPYCATTNTQQDHKILLSASADDPYVVAAVECSHAVAFPKASGAGAPPARNAAPPPVARPPVRPRH